ncbi:hypothetical protein N7510_005226 [Penicillium lagena]|uniref:uncharacterized protein n=1 Tax=Penicillium lagena TaxID=94218 RepID=UPI002540C80D|nr:uncharacterized protein N7510_005226 [Penicillium lagena]KAJ5612032.1 hypothetical protein N7510_005226 [Penicillium lagena]
MLEMEEALKYVLVRNAFSLPVIERYKEVIRSENQSEVIEHLPCGPSVGWFGAKSAKKVLAYIHGGGLVMNGSVMQVGLAYNAYKLRGPDKDTAVALLAYDTCPVAPYPTQLRQTVAFIQHLLKDHDPEDIELFGESAGGTLILALLLHFSHPHPAVAPFSLPSGHRLGRTLLISPSAPVVTSAASMTENIGKDTITPDMLSNLWAAIEAHHDPEVELVNHWLTPAIVLDKSWYEDLPIGGITILIGALELLRDDIIKVAGVIKEKHTSSVDIQIFPNAGHCLFLVEKMLDLPRSDYSLAIDRWIGEAH